MNDRDAEDIHARPNTMSKTKTRSRKPGPTGSTTTTEDAR